MGIYFTDPTASLDPSRRRLLISESRTSSPRVRLYSFSTNGTISIDSTLTAFTPPDQYQPTRYLFFPDGTRIADTLGNVYVASPLSIAGSPFAPGFIDMAFHGSEIPIILRPGRLTSYSNALTESGSAPLSSTLGVRLTLHADDAVVFSLDPVSPRGLRTESIPLQALNLNTPGLPVNPRNLAFTPDASLTTTDGVVWLLSRLHLSIFRWSPATRDFLPNIPLKETPLFISHSSADRRIYLYYQNGITTFLDASAPLPAEQPFASAASFASSMTAADPFVAIPAPNSASSTSDRPPPHGTKTFVGSERSPPPLHPALLTQSAPSSSLLPVNSSQQPPSTPTAPVRAR